MNKFTTLNGGQSNTSSGDFSIVGGGRNNIADGVNSGIFGGRNNTINSHSSSFIIGSNLSASSDNTTYTNNLHVSSSLVTSFIEPGYIPTPIPYTPDYKEGRMFWNSDYSNWVYYTDQDFQLRIGKEIIWRIYNSTGTTLATGTPVYLSGSTNNIDPDVFPCSANGTFTKVNTVGVIRHTTPSGETGYVLQGGVIHDIDMDGFTIGDDIYISTIPGELTNVSPVYPYESVKIGNCQSSGIHGSLIVCSPFFIPPIIPYAGMTSIPTIIFDGTGSIIVSSGSVNLYSNADGSGDIFSYPLLETPLTLITGSTNYITVTLSGTSAIYEIGTDSTYANGISIVRVGNIDINTTDIPWKLNTFKIGNVGFGLANKINNKDIVLNGFQRQYGLILDTTGSLTDFTISQGLVWYGPNPAIISTYNTQEVDDECYHYIKSGSVWNIISIPGYDNENYNGPDGLLPLTDSYWTVNYIFRFMGSSNVVAVVLDTAEYSTEILAAVDSKIPAELPQTFSDLGMLVARIIVQSGSYVPTIEGAFGVTFNSSVSTNHENLLGLQGGIAGEHHHLTQAEYTGTGTGVFVRQDNPTITGSITSASYASVASYMNMPVNTFVGVTESPIITSLGSGNITVGTGSVNLCTTLTGNFIVNYSVPSMNFTVNTSSLLNVQYVVATYNSGSPIWKLITDSSTVDSIQTTIAYVLTAGITGAISIASYDNPGMLLANKLLLRTQTTQGISRETGLTLGTSGSLYVTVTSGSAWAGINQIQLSAVNSNVDRFILLAHSSSIIKGTVVTQMTNTMCDNGTDVVPLGAGNDHWVANYIYRGIGSQNSSGIMYSNDYTSEASVRLSQPPTQPAELLDISLLLGRVIYKKNVDIPVSIDSAFTTTFASAGVTEHNELNGLQGGIGGQYYHLTAAEYGNTTSGSFVRESGSLISGSITNATSASYALSSSYSDNSISSSYSLTSSFAEVSISASYSNNATSALTASSINFTTDLANTASYNVSSSHSLNSDNSVSSSYSLSSSYSNNATSALTASSINFTPNLANTASYILASNVNGTVTNASTASYLTAGTYTITSSWANNATSSSYALSSSYSLSGSWSANSGQANNALIAGSAGSATTANTASYVDAGNITTGTLNNSRLPSQINVTGITGSHYGTSSWANNATSALTASSINFTPTLANTASYILASGISGTVTNASTASYLNAGTYTITSSWANNVVSSSYSKSGSYALSSSYGLSSSYALSSSYSNNSTSASYSLSSSYLFGHIGAGTTSSAALTFDSGQLLTTASAGVLSYDGINFYGTIDTTNGRGSIPVEQHFLLTATGSNISTIANYFGTNSNIPLVANGIYEIDVYQYFLKNTNGTVTWTFAYNAAPTSFNFTMERCPYGGISVPAANSNNSLFYSSLYNDVSSPYTFTSAANLSGGNNQYYHFKIFLIAAATTNYIKLQMTSTTGTVTPGIGSRWFSKRLSSTNVGTFAA